MHEPAAGRCAMDIEPPQPPPQSFCLMVWRDAPDLGGRRGTWHGQIVHVQSGARAGVSSLDEAMAFIAGYMDEMGIDRGLRRRLRQWLAQRTG